MFKAEEREAVRILFEELGFVKTVRIAARVQSRVFAGDPFADLPEPEDQDERLSRRQIAPAIVLYEELLASFSQERAYEVVERVAVEGAVQFLSRTIGSLQREDLVGLDDESMREFVHAKGEKFFNAELRWETVRDDEVEFVVEFCHFPPLCEAVGYPELAPVFCAGDAKFFGGVEDDVELERSETIAKGGETCPFHIYFD